MNKYALLCAVVIAAPVLAEGDRAERSGKDLAKEVVRSQVEGTRSCSNCCKCNNKCSSCCGCKSVDTSTETAVKKGEEESAATRKCSSCGCSCGNCGCK